MKTSVRPICLLLGLSCTLWATAQCDTLDFEGYPSDTPFLTQYQSCGVVFSSNGVPTPPLTYDYGSTSWTSVLHSYDWYGELRMDFVDPVDGTTPLPVSFVSFDNPIDSEIDHIVGSAYDVNDNVLTAFSSASPDRVEISLPGPSIAYIIMDDANTSAYVIDNLVFGGAGTVGLAENQTAVAVHLWPTMAQDAVTIRSSGTEQASVLSADGRVVMGFSIAAGQQTMDVGQLPSGTYLVVLHGTGRVLRFVKA